MNTTRIPIGRNRISITMDNETLMLLDEYRKDKKRSLILEKAFIKYYRESMKREIAPISQTITEKMKF